MCYVTGFLRNRRNIGLQLCDQSLDRGMALSWTNLGAMVTCANPHKLLLAALNYACNIIEERAFAYITT